MLGLTFNKKELGKSLVEMAKEKRNGEMRDRVADKVVALMNQIAGQDKLSKDHAELRDFYQHRLDAINDGDFDILEDGRIVYTKDAELNDQYK